MEKYPLLFPVKGNHEERPKVKKLRYKQLRAELENNHIKAAYYAYKIIEKEKELE